jgi:hypothetical protein
MRRPQSGLPFRGTRRTAALLDVVRHCHRRHLRIPSAHKLACGITLMFRVKRGWDISARMALVLSGGVHRRLGARTPPTEGRRPRGRAGRDVDGPADEQHEGGDAERREPPGRLPASASLPPTAHRWNDKYPYLV